MRSVVFSLLLATSAITGCSSIGVHAPAAPANSAKTIAWRSWDASAFDDAKKDGKLVLVDVGIEGCTACRWMYEETYRDPQIVAKLRESFVTIAVDADVQPDLGARFEEWGWPATIVLTPEGAQVFALRGSRSPEVFAKILDEIVAKKRQGKLHATTDSDEKRPPAPIDETSARIMRALDASMNAEHGGFTDEGPQYIQGPSIELAFSRARTEKRPELRAHALKTLEGYAKMIDPVWGGVYVAAHEVDFSGLIVEKRLVQEAEAMRSFALAFSATHEEKWKTRAADIDRYIASFLLAPDGTFYSTQQDEAPNLPPRMSSSDYFKLPDAERRKYGVPPVDHAVYTDQNAQAIEAYAMLYEATGEQRMLDRATRAASTLLATRVDRAGWVRQAEAGMLSDARKRAFRPQNVPYLTAQAHFVNALLALHRVTGEARWFESARSIMSAAQHSLEDQKEGGFYASPTERTEKPVFENVVAARALASIGVYAHDAELARVAERTIRSAGATRGALLALVVQDLVRGPIDISITGTPSDVRGIALHRAALATHEPRKAIHWDGLVGARRYPVTSAPALYVCTKNACSSPIRNPALVAEAIAKAE